MRTFVLTALAAVLTPAALSAQVLFLASPGSVAASRVPRVNVDLPKEFSLPSFTAERAPIPSRPDYKMRVVRPPDEPRARMRVALPDERYDYKMLMPRRDAPPSARSSPRRKR